MTQDRELEEVLALLEKATPGEWSHAPGYGWNITSGTFDPLSRLAGSIGTAIYPADAEAIAAAVNFLRKHGPALLSRTPAGEDARPSENGPFKVIADRGKVHVASDDFTHDAWLHVTGDFGTDEQHREYAEWVARTLNAATEKERA